MPIFDYDKKKDLLKNYLENDLKTKVINNIKSVNKITCDITKKAVNVTAKNASASIEKLKQLYDDCKGENLYDKASNIKFKSINTFNGIKSVYNTTSKVLKEELKTEFNDDLNVYILEFEFLKKNNQDVYIHITSAIKNSVIDSDIAAFKVRKALEILICKVTKKFINCPMSLYENIKFLKKNGAIPDNIYKLCDIIRQIGNKGVHTEDIINKDVKQIIKYFHEISIWLNGKYF